MATVFLRPYMITVSGSCGDKQVPICNKVCGSSKCRKSIEKGRCPSLAKGNMSECLTYRYIDLSVGKGVLRTVPVTGGVVEFPFSRITRQGFSWYRSKISLVFLVLEIICLTFILRFARIQKLVKTYSNIESRVNFK